MTRPLFFALASSHIRQSVTPTIFSVVETVFPPGPLGPVPPKPTTPRERGCLTTFLLAAGAFVLFCLIIGCGLWILWRPKAPSGAKMQSLPVVTAIREVLRVSTIEMELADVVKFSEDRPLLGLIPRRKDALYRVHGKVTAGFDLQDPGFVIRTDEATKVLTLMLPRAQVTSIDPVVEILDEKGSWLNAVTTEDRNVWYKWARGDLRRAALDAGITERAEERARKLVVALAGSWGYRADVTFAGAPEHPATAASSAEITGER